MDFLKQFAIPIKGLLDGCHQYEFLLDDEFFKHFEASPIERAHLVVKLDLDKQVELLVMGLNIKGYIPTACDRCLADIDLPIDKSYKVVVKRAEGISDDPDLVHLAPDAHELPIGELLYDYACLSVPLIKRFDCSGLTEPPCNQEVLKYIQKEEKTKEINPIWDELKKLKTN
jgi:uncharacterized protein